MSATTFLRRRNYAGDTCKNEEFPAATFGKAFCIFWYLGLAKNIDWCNDNFDAITIKAEKLYKIVTETPDKMKNLTKRCCDFKKLELVLEKRKK